VLKFSACNSEPRADGPSGFVDWIVDEFGDLKRNQALLLDIVSGSPAQGYPLADDTFRLCEARWRPTQQDVGA